LKDRVKVALWENSSGQVWLEMPMVEMWNHELAFLWKFAMLALLWDTEMDWSGY
jgi:hypothetical protein